MTVQAKWGNGHHSLLQVGKIGHHARFSPQVGEIQGRYRRKRNKLKCKFISPTSESEVVVVMVTKPDAAGGWPHSGPQCCWEVLMVCTQGDPPTAKAAKKPALAEHGKTPEHLLGCDWSHGQAQLQMDWANWEI